MRAVLSAILLCTAACNAPSLRYAIFPGKPVQEQIDGSIAQSLVSYNPALKVEPSKCASIMLVSEDSPATCTLTVNGVPLKIRVLPAQPPYQFKVDFAGAYFFHMPMVEKTIEDDLVHNYNIKAAAHCGNPRERLIAPGTYFVCAIEGSSKVRSDRVKVTPNGQLFVFNVPGLKTASSPLTSLLTPHKKGKTTIASGTDVKAFILQYLDSNPQWRASPGVVACPMSIDLTGKKRGVCTVNVPKLRTPERIGVVIDDSAGFRVWPIDEIVDRDQIEAAAQADLNRRLTASGYKADAVVVCDGGLVVVKVPSTFSCEASAQGEPYKLEVSVDVNGVRWRAVSVGRGG